LLELGHKASAEQLSPRKLRKLSRLAEEVGFESVLGSDRFQDRCIRTENATIYDEPATPRPYQAPFLGLSSGQVPPQLGRAFG